MDLPYRSPGFRVRALGACLLVGCLLAGCGSELPPEAQAPQIPAGPGPRVVPVGSGGVSAPAAVGGTVAPAPSQIGTGMSAVGSDPLGVDAGVGPQAGAAGASAGRGGAGGRAGAGGAGGRAGAGGAAGASVDETCRNVFCFTPIECLFFTIPCGFSDCVNFSCQ